MRVPGTPGVQAPEQNPFLNAGDILESGDRESDWASRMADLQSRVDEIKAQAPGALADIQRGGTMARDSASSDLASRGIFSSSISDLALADIQAQQTMQEQNVNNLVAAAERALTEGRDQIEGLGGERQRFGTYLGNRAVENATEANANRPYLQDPTAAHTEIDRDPGKPGIQNKPPAPVSVHVQVGGGGERSARARRRAAHGDPFAAPRRRR